MLTASALSPPSAPTADLEEPRWGFLLTAANVVLCLGVGWWTWHVQREAALVPALAGRAALLGLQRQAFTLITAPGCIRWYYAVPG